jgi:large subunit ribosomal protein L13
VLVDGPKWRRYYGWVRFSSPVKVRTEHLTDRSLEDVVKTYHAKPGEVEREWLIVDATDLVLGRLATQVAQILKGKTKPQYTPHIDTGDFVIIVNAEKVRLTGNKAQTKMYYSHSGFIGGLKEVSYQRMLDKHPERIIEKAVKGMLPKNTLGRAMNRKLKVYAGPNHPHAAQKPREITLEA